MNNEDRFEAYYNKYGEFWTEARQQGNELSRATFRVCYYGETVDKMAQFYDEVDEQQLWDNVRCQQAHDMWCDSLEVQ